MVTAYCVVCQLAAAGIVFTSNRRYIPANGISSPSSSSPLCHLKLSQSQLSASPRLVSFNFRLELRRKGYELSQRRHKFVVSAELSKPFSLSFGLDYQVGEVSFDRSLFISFYLSSKLDFKVSIIFLCQIRRVLN